jgi:hypothetical protein
LGHRVFLRDNDLLFVSLFGKIKNIRLILKSDRMEGVFIFNYGTISNVYGSSPKCLVCNNHGGIITNSSSGTSCFCSGCSNYGGFTDCINNVSEPVYNPGNINDLAIPNSAIFINGAKVLIKNLGNITGFTRKISVYNGNYSMVDKEIMTNFAPPYDVFDNKTIFRVSPEIIGSPLSGTVKINVSVENLGGVVFNKGYYYNVKTSDWEIFNFPQTTLSGSSWISNSASLELNLPSENLDSENIAIAVFACKKKDGILNCGCQDSKESRCRRWMVQIVKVAQTCEVDSDCPSSVVISSCSDNLYNISRSYNCVRPLREDFPVEPGMPGNSVDDKGFCILNSSITKTITKSCDDSDPRTYDSCSMDSCLHKTIPNSCIADSECSAEKYCETNRCMSRLSGSGTLEDPFKIISWTQLNYMRYNSSASYILMNNLSSKDVDYIALGDNWQPIEYFSGNFNGNGNTISDLKLANTFTQGLFHTLSGNISNIGLINVNISCMRDCGSLVVYNFGVVSKSYSTGDISAGESSGGGLVAQNYGEISNSYSLVNVRTNYFEYSFLGGLGGFNYNTGIISNCYAMGNVLFFEGNSNGGLVGYNWNGVITNSFWDIETSGITTSNGGGGEGKTTSQMKQQSTYTGWDFVNIWAIDPTKNNGYPYLKWQNL